jgi:hypothetical protein
MTHHPIVSQALYYCIVAIVPTPQPRKPQTCNNIIWCQEAFLGPCFQRRKNSSPGGRKMLDLLMHAINSIVG